MAYFLRRPISLANKSIHRLRHEGEERLSGIQVREKVLNNLGVILRLLLRLSTVLADILEDRA